MNTILEFYEHLDRARELVNKIWNRIENLEIEEVTSLDLVKADELAKKAIMDLHFIREHIQDIKYPYAARRKQP